MFNNNIQKNNYKYNNNMNLYKSNISTSYLPNDVNINNKNIYNNLAFNNNVSLKSRPHENMTYNGFTKIDKPVNTIPRELYLSRNNFNSYLKPDNGELVGYNNNIDPNLLHNKMTEASHKNMFHIATKNANGFNHNENIMPNYKRKININKLSLNKKNLEQFDSILSNNTEKKTTINKIYEKPGNLNNSNYLNDKIDNNNSEYNRTNKQNYLPNSTRTKLINENFKSSDNSLKNNIIENVNNSNKKPKNDNNKNRQNSIISDNKTLKNSIIETCSNYFNSIINHFDINKGKSLHKKEITNINSRNKNTGELLNFKCKNIYKLKFCKKKLDDKSYKYFQNEYKKKCKFSDLQYKNNSNKKNKRITHNEHKLKIFTSNKDKFKIINDNSKNSKLKISKKIKPYLIESGFNNKNYNENFKQETNNIKGQKRNIKKSIIANNSTDYKTQSNFMSKEIYKNQKSKYIKSNKLHNRSKNMDYDHTNMNRTEQEAFISSNKNKRNESTQYEYVSNQNFKEGHITNKRKINQNKSYKNNYYNNDDNFKTESFSKNQKKKKINKKKFNRNYSLLSNKI